MKSKLNGWKKKLKSDPSFIPIAIGRVLMITVRPVIVYFSTRYLGVELFGLLAFATSVGIIFSTFSGFGGPQRMFQFVYDRKIPLDEAYGNSFSILLINSLLITFGFYIYSSNLDHSSETTLALTLIVFCEVFFQTLKRFHIARLQCMNASKPIIYVDVMTFVPHTIIGIIIYFFASQSPFPLLTWAKGILIADLIYFIFAETIFWNLGSRIKLKLFKLYSNSKFSLSLIFQEIFSRLARETPKVFLLHFGFVAAAGNYLLVQKLGNLFILFPFNVFLLSSQSVLYSHSGNVKAVIKESISKLAAPAIFLTTIALFICLVFPSQIINLAASKEYSIAIEMLPYYIFGVCVRTINVSLARICNVINAIWTRNLITAIISITATVCYYFFGRTWGWKAIIYIFICMEIILAISYFAVVAFSISKNKKVNS